MPIPFYMDVHVPQPIMDQLRHRGVDVLTAIEDGARELPDDEILERARDLGRVVFTQDIGFKALAEDWQRHGATVRGVGFRASNEGYDRSVRQRLGTDRSGIRIR